MIGFVIILGALLAGIAGWAWRLRGQLQDQTEANERAKDLLRQAHETALVEQRGQLAAVLGQMLEGLIVVDAAGRIQLVNRAAALLFGIKAAVEGRPLLEAVRHHDFAALLARLEHEPEVAGYELHMEGAKVRTLQINAVRLRDGSGRPSGALFVMHDLTEQRKLEGMREEFVANVSHELRTPLSLIKGATETLLDGGRNDPAVTEKFLGIIDRHSSRLNLLIEDLLLLSSLDSGRITLRTAPVDFRQLADEVLEDFQGTAADSGITLVASLPETFLVRGDAGRLRQILSNLIDNAIKHGGKGKVEIGGATLSPGWVQFWVRDEGPGIPDEARGRVFERFYRVDKSRARPQGGGTGLGLAIVKNLAQAHGGEVRVESSLGKGTTFFVKLPSGEFSEDGASPDISH